jgi:hypothetical protein
LSSRRRLTMEAVETTARARSRHGADNEGLYSTNEAIRPVPAPAGRWPARYRYLLLGAVVTILASIQTANGQWSTDMWEHVAVVRELIAKPFHPAHPLLLVSQPHPDYSPYTVVLGILGHLLGTDAVTMLSLAAVANVVLLLIGLRLFVIEATDNRRAPFWVLVFVLLLWGPSPYRFSGFLNVNSIGFVLPYPSAFATATALFTLTAALRAYRSLSWPLLFAVAGGFATVVLVHPITGAWLAVALLAVALSRGRDVRAWIWIAGAGALALAVVLAWPYYSVLDILGNTHGYDTGNTAMYHNAVPRLIPAAVGLWVISRRLRADRRDLFALMLIGGVAIYLYGYVRDQYSYGRALAFVVLVLDIAAGDGVARVEARFTWAQATGWLRAGAVALCALLLLGVVNTRAGLIRMVPTDLLPASVRDSRQFDRVDDRYAFLERYVSSHDVVVGTTDQDNIMIPAIAGRTLELGRPSPAIRDADARSAAQAEFLNPATTTARRAEIRVKYKVRFVLLHPGDPYAAQVAKALELAGARTLIEEHGFQLLALGD